MSTVIEHKPLLRSGIRVEIDDLGKVTVWGSPEVNVGFSVDHESSFGCDEESPNYFKVNVRQAAFSKVTVGVSIPHTQKYLGPQDPGFEVTCESRRVVISQNDNLDPPSTNRPEQVSTKS